LILGQEEAEKGLHPNELHVRKQLVVFISQRSEELRPYSLVNHLTISNSDLKALASNAFLS
jgi:hypothetical protein